MTCFFPSNATIGVCKQFPTARPEVHAWAPAQQIPTVLPLQPELPITNITLCFESDHLYCDTSSGSPGCKSLLTAGDDCTTDAACGGARIFAMPSVEPASY